MTTTSAQSADAVVVGAGHNGLVGGQPAGRRRLGRCVVLEATAQPGGAVRSAEVTAPGYLSDLFSSFYPLGYASPVLGGLDLGGTGCPGGTRRTCWRTCCPTAGAAVINRDLDVTAASLEQFAPGDGERWLDAYADWLEVAEPLLDALFTAVPAGTRRAGPAASARRRPARCDWRRRLVRAGPQTRRRAVRGEGGPAAAGRLRPAHRPVAGRGRRRRFGWLLAMLGQQVGWPVPVGGAQQITDALVARLQERGGEIVYGAPRRPGARSPGGRAMGVRTTAARCAGPAGPCSPTCRRRRSTSTWSAPAALPPRLVEDLAHFRWDGST